MYVKTKQRAKSFLISLLAATLLWVFYTMSRSYSYVLLYPLSVQLIDEESKEVYSSRSDIAIQFETSGLEAIYRRYNRDKKRLYLSVTQRLTDRNTTEFILHLPQYRKELFGQFFRSGPSMTLLTDKLRIPLQKEYVRKVRVDLDSIRYRFASGFRLSTEEDPFLFPDSVLLRGDSSLLSGIGSISTRTLSLDQVSGSGVYYLNLSADTFDSTIQISPSILSYYLPVEEYTEQTITLPVRLIGQTELDETKPFPDKVNLTFSVSLAEYEKINLDMFELTARMSDTVKGKMRVVIDRFPSSVRIQKIYPQEVGYVLVK